MSLKKQYLKSKPICKVTFKLKASEANNAGTAKLVGDFNAWDIQAEPMKKLKNVQEKTRIYSFSLEQNRTISSTM